MRIAAESVVNGNVPLELGILELKVELDVVVPIGLEVELDVVVRIELEVGLGILEIVFIILKFPEVVVPSCPP